jgi:hypothetical protein
VAIQEQERELESWESDLERKEDVLREYVGTQIEDLEEEVAQNVEGSVWAALDEYRAEQGSGRLGVTGGMLVALFGVALVAAGAANGVAIAADGGVPTALASDAGNIAVTAVFALVGLGLALSAAVDRL